MIKKSLIIAALAASIASGHIYPATMQVWDNADSFVQVETANGELFSFEDHADRYEDGELVSLLMWDNGTPENLDDDIILTHVKSGFSR